MMNTNRPARLAAGLFAAMMTVAMLMSIDTLASRESTTAEMARAQPAASPLACADGRLAGAKGA
jgi:hypothetical protein